jgi:tetraacyldisaccharide 4'-kinase
MTFNFLNPYAYILRIRRWMYRNGKLKSFGVGIPVISVGNLTVGGSGKTPLVIRIAERIQQEQNLKVGIVLRGYKRESKGCVVVSDGESVLVSIEQSGDEAMLFASSLPNAIVVVDEDRVRGAERAMSLGAQVVLLDDGYQHIRLRRDLNILLVDAERGVGSVLPFGRAREDVSAARDANFLIITNAEDEARMEKIQRRMLAHSKTSLATAATITLPVALESLTNSAAGIEGVEYLEGKQVLAISSIASPQRFHNSIAACGAIVLPHVLPDHAAYSALTVERAFEQAERTGCEAIVTTTKDAVKAYTFYRERKGAIPVFVLHTELQFIAGEQELWEAIQNVLKQDS